MSEISYRRKAKSEKYIIWLEIPRTGRYPEMEEKLSSLLTEVRDQDIIVES